MRIKADQPVAAADLNSIGKVLTKVTRMRETAFFCADVATNCFMSVQTSDQVPSVTERLAARDLKLTRENLYKEKLARYPFLERTDRRLKMTDEEIMNRDIDLTGCVLSEPEKRELRAMLLARKDAFSLHSEKGNCTRFEVDFELTSDDPFYIRPYTVSQAEKVLIDRELERLERMGVLAQGMTDFSSPVMLVSKKGTKDKRVVADFRYLNQRFGGTIIRSHW